MPWLPVALRLVAGIVFDPGDTRAQEVRPALSDRAVQERANRLLHQMTPEEKMGQVFAFAAGATMERRIRAGE